MVKVAEALAQRADTQTRLAQLRARIAENARYQEGDAPAEDPRALLDEAERLADELAVLIRRINRTNATTAFDDARTVTDVLAERDVLAVRRKLYADAAQAAVVRLDRYMRSEIRMVSALDVAAMRRRADELARTYRELDTRIQESNWSTELAD